MRKKILTGLIVIGILALAINWGTYSYYSDTGTSSANAFTSGTMDLRLNGEDSVTATWKSPSNWSPGKTVTGTISLTNVGNVYAETLLFDFKNLVITDGGSDGSDLSTKIYVTDWDFYKEGTWISGPGDFYMWLFDVDGNGDGHCSLYELTIAPNYTPYMWECPLEDLTLIEDKDLSGTITYGDIVRTPAGAPESSGVCDAWGGIRMTFEFDPDAGNEYQADTASFDLEVKIFNDASEDITYVGEGCGHGWI